MPADYDYRNINYLEVCDAAQDGDAEDARKVAEGIRAVIKGDIDEFLYDYPCHSETSRHWYYMRAIRMSGNDPIRVVVSHEDITALKLTEEALNKSRESLTEQKQSLEEANIALKVLLKQREEDKLDLEKKVLNNVKDLVLPYVEKLKNAPLKPPAATVLQCQNIADASRDAGRSACQRRKNQQRNRRRTERLRNYHQFSPQESTHKIRPEKQTNQPALVSSIHILMIGSPYR
jgi:hypothetical protein